MQYVRDPVHGDVALTEEEYEVLETVEMQRLNRLRQLHLVYLVYPGATHSRLAHSIGVLHATRRVIKESNLPYSREKERLLGLAALLHDVAHSCFAHVLEPSFTAEFMPLHEDVTQFVLDGRIQDYWSKFSSANPRELESVRFVADVLDQDTRSEVGAILSNKRPGLSELVSGIVDADNLDYIRRDSAFLGFPSASYDDAIYSGFMLEERDGTDRLVVRDNQIILSAVEDVIKGRWYLFRHAYLHHAVMAANAMLIDAVRLTLKGDAFPALYVLGDDELLHALAHGDSLWVKSDSDALRGRELASRLAHRQLYKRCFSINVTGPKAQRHYDAFRRSPPEAGRFLNTLREATGRNALIGYPIVPPAKDYLRLPVEGHKFLDEGLKEAALERYGERYRQLEVLYVYIDTENWKIREQVNKICQQEFKDAGEYDLHQEESRSERTLVELESAVERLMNQRRAAVRVLEVLLSGEELTTAQICVKTSLSAGTVSLYLKSLGEAFRLSRAHVVRRHPSQTGGVGKRAQLWSIPDKRHRDLLSKVIANA